MLNYKKFIKKNKSQIWIETAIYTLIGLTIIAILLSAGVPQIEKIKDKSIVKQTRDALNILDSKILDIEESKGSIRIIFFGISKGKIEIDSENNKIKYILENTRLELTEPGEKVEEGDMILETQKYGDRFNIFLTADYNKTLDMRVEMENKNKILQAGTTPYKIQIENLGYNETEQKTIMNFNIL